MDRTAGCSSSYNTVKTDLSLLLECLKFQMKCPDLQKQALLTIQSICEGREDNVDLLREMGGVDFVYNLSKSSIVHADVKESALFTLGTLAEANVHCKSSLCRKEIFSTLAGWLIKDNVSLAQKRVSVYLLFVLVSNNKSGQTLAQTTGCLDILLHLFRTTFPLSTGDTSRAANATQTYQLWASVSSALCGCVNNPQNEDGQRICVAAFPIIKIWLEQISMPRTEIFQPICSFIAMAVANNPCVQESFSASGGLETLIRALVRLAPAAESSLLSCQLSVIIIKTLSACIADNSALASGLAQCGVVSHLFSLLTSPHLDPEDRLCVLLSLGHCTVASEEHQSQLVQCGGLPLVITFLTEDTSEEVRKAATFILQTCKQATMCLEVPGLMVKQAGDVEPLTDFRSSARELLHRIDLLEKKHVEEVKDEQEDTDLLEERYQPPQPSALPPQRKEGGKTVPTHAQAGGDTKLLSVSNVTENERNSEVKKKASTVWCSLCKGTGTLLCSDERPLERGSESHTVKRELFKPPLAVRHTKQNEKECAEELLDSEMSKDGKTSVEERPVSRTRCSGCVLPFEEVTSRTFASLQISGQHSCDMHKVLQEATERYRMRHRNLVLRKEHQDNTVKDTDPNSDRVSAAEPQRSSENYSVKEVFLTPMRKGAGNDKSSLPENIWRKYNGVTLTPLRRRGQKESFISGNRTGSRMTPLKRQHLPEDRIGISDLERRGGSNSGQHALDDQSKIGTDRCSTRRKRKDFSREEVRYLLSGVKMHGFSWNFILWSYPFQPGRTNVDLAKKYRQLVKRKTQDAGCAHY